MDRSIGYDPLIYLSPFLRIQSVYKVKIVRTECFSALSYGNIKKHKFSLGIFDEVIKNGFKKCLLAYCLKKELHLTKLNIHGVIEKVLTRIKEKRSEICNLLKTRRNVREFNLKRFNVYFL